MPTRRVSIGREVSAMRAYREESVADGIADELEGANDRLEESLFVGDVVDELCTVDDDHAPAYATFSTRFCIRDCANDAPIMFSWKISPYCSASSWNERRGTSRSMAVT